MDEVWCVNVGQVPYEPARELQKRLETARHAGDVPDLLLLLEHPPTYTRGRRSEPSELPMGVEWYEMQGIEVRDTDRGGRVTYHGPGQLVGYPIVALPDHVKVVDYVRRVEEALIGACAELGVTTARVPGRSGVWLRADDRGPERKIAAIGLRVSRGVTMHGFSLNCDVDLAWYDRFVPCGIADAGVTTLTAELGRRVTTYDVLPVVERHLRELLAWAPYVPTPDYDAKPEPGRPPRIELVRPSEQPGARHERTA